MSLLFIDACVRTQSRTRYLAEEVLRKWDGEIDTIQLYNIEIPQLDEHAITERYLAAEQSDESNPFVHLAIQFRDAEAIVIAAPHWDMGFPARLKLYLEAISIAGITFVYNEEGDSVGCCQAKRLVYVTTAGGEITETEFGFSYIKKLARSMYGIDRVTCYKAEDLDIEGSDLDAIMKASCEEIQRYSFYDQLMAADDVEDDAEYIIKTKNLTLKYGSFVANNNINLHVKKGAIYGLIGRNGAGKTTLLRMIVGMSRPTKGSLELMGVSKSYELREARNKVGSIIDSPAFYSNFSVYDTMKLRAKLIGLNNPKQEILDVLQKVGLSELKRKKIKTMSLGEIQTLAIATAILGDPSLLVLDEPMNGLDAVSTANIRKLLLEMNENGTTIIISSHILGELNKIVTNVGYLLNGELIREVTQKDIEELDIDLEDELIKLEKEVQ